MWCKIPQAFLPVIRGIISCRRKKLVLLQRQGSQLRPQRVQFSRVFRPEMHLAVTFQLFILFQQDAAHQPEKRGFVRKHAYHLGPALEKTTVPVLSEIM